MTLEELKQKRKEINEEIKRLENKDFFQTGSAKIDKDHFATGKPDDYKICVRYKPIDRRSMWVCIAKSTDKKEVIEKLPEIIRDISQLYHTLLAEEI